MIVFESGLGEDMRRWEKVARPLAACARIVLYDRPGIGRSSPRTGTDVLLASTVVNQLAMLLNSIDTAPPYILVGHSLGGFYVQAFARKRPQEVAAVVPVDSASPFEPPGVFGSTVPPAPGSIMAARPQMISSVFQCAPARRSNKCASLKKNLPLNARKSVTRNKR